jgi:hypothetical protein
MVQNIIALAPRFSVAPGKKAKASPAVTAQPDPRELAHQRACVLAPFESAYLAASQEAASEEEFFARFSAEAGRRLRQMTGLRVVS